MNTPMSDSPVERKRKQVIQLCKSIIKYMETQDGREKIDTQLDEACDRLVMVTMKMHDYWVRGVEERLAYEQAMKGASFARAHAPVTKVKQGQTGSDNVAKMLKKLKLENPAEFQRIIANSIDSFEELGMEKEELDAEKEKGL